MKLPFLLASWRFFAVDFAEESADPVRDFSERWLLAMAALAADSTELADSCLLLEMLWAS